MALPQQETLDGVERGLAALGGSLLPPRLVLHRHVEQGENGWEGLPNRLTKRQQPGRKKLAQALAGVPLVELKVIAEEVDQREIGRGLAIRD